MRILVAMSGGVDSTIAAYILKQEGHEVIGVNFKFVNDAPVGATTDSVEAFLASPIVEVNTNLVEVNTNLVGATHREPDFQNSELESIGQKLGIKIIYRDFSCEFKQKVITSFVRDYENGITPNPCALCNGTMKFEKLLKVMKEENCDMIATGHYANVTTVGANVDTVGANADTVGANDALVGANADTVGANACGALRYCIKKSKNQQKDQSYMLYRLSQEQLSHIIFPIGDMDKNDVRKIAADLGLSVSDKKDSQDVCFVSNDLGYQEFIKRFEFGDDYKEKIALGKLKEDDISSKSYLKKGEFVDVDGNVVGFHNGIINYTIGQRRGLNIAFGERKFVVKIDAKNNQVVLGDNDDLMYDTFEINDIVYSGMTENDIINIINNAKKDNNNEKIKDTNLSNDSINSVRLFAKLRYRHDGTEVARVDATLVRANADTVGANADFVGANADTVGANVDTVGATHREPSIGANADTVGANADTVGANVDTVGANADFVGANACGALTNDESQEHIKKLTIKLNSKVRAITPGQAAVFYDSEGRIMFGGRIL